MNKEQKIFVFHNNKPFPWFSDRTLYITDEDDSEYNEIYHK